MKPTTDFTNGNNIIYFKLTAMTLLIAFLLIKGLHLSAGWYLVSFIVWVLHLRTYSD